MTHKVILTGLRANNDLTLGNYFGGIMPMIDMAKTRSSEYQINMFIPDLHSFTTPIEHSDLYEQVLRNARLFVAAGLPLDNDTIHLYRQSFVPAHSELAWILDCFTGLGEMQRMTQFSEKSNGQASIDLAKLNGKNIREIAKLLFGDTSIGLLNYPVLMASDILLYGATYVPVGDDQSQHLEFTRDIAQRMNRKFGELFTVPEEVSKQHDFFGKDQGLRIKDLQDPTKKMSKSDESTKGVIFLGDEPELAAKKIMSATTDDAAYIRFDSEGQPGIANLIQILALLRGVSVGATARQFEGQTSYGDFKSVVAAELKSFLEDFQQKLASVDNATILSKLESSEVIMNQQANETLLHVQEAVGLRKKVA